MVQGGQRAQLAQHTHRVYSSKTNFAAHIVIVVALGDGIICQRYDGAV